MGTAPSVLQQAIGQAKWAISTMAYLSAIGRDELPTQTALNASDIRKNQSQRLLL